MLNRVQCCWESTAQPSIFADPLCCQGGLYTLYRIIRESRVCRRDTTVFIVIIVFITIKYILQKRIVSSDQRNIKMECFRPGMVGTQYPMAWVETVEIGRTRYQLFPQLTDQSFDFPVLSYKTFGFLSSSLFHPTHYIIGLLSSDFSSLFSFLNARSPLHPLVRAPFSDNIILQCLQQLRPRPRPLSSRRSPSSSATCCWAQDWTCLRLHRWDRYGILLDDDYGISGNGFADLHLSRWRWSRQPWPQTGATASRALWVGFGAVAVSSVVSDMSLFSQFPPTCVL